MRKIVFLGGSELDSSSWGDCMKILESNGYRCRAIDWLGMLATPEPGEIVERIVRQLDDFRGGDLALLGHSAGGLLLPGIGLGTGAEIAIYVAALVAHPGENFHERVFSNEPVFEEEWLAAWAQRPPDERKIERLLFHDCPPGTRARYWKANGTELARVYDRVTPREDGFRVRHYITCTQDRTIHVEWQRQAGRPPRYRPWEFESGHCPQLAKPQAFARLMMKLLCESGESGGSGITRTPAAPDQCTG